MSVFSLMTPVEIRDRLAVVATLEADHSARDLDGELSIALRAGGDVDALETAQLEAERQARRLRVERVALTGELPEAIKRDGTAKLAGLIAEHQTMAKTAPEKVHAVCQAWAAYKAAVKDFADLQDQAAAVTRRAGTIAGETKAECQSLGTFQSKRLIGVVVENHDTWRSLASAENPMNTIRGPQGTRID